MNTIQDATTKNDNTYPNVPSGQTDKFEIKTLDEVPEVEFTIEKKISEVEKQLEETNDLLKTIISILKDK